jgi:hypothetical protein
MCGKTSSVSKGNKLRYDPNDPASLIEALLNDPNRKRIWEDRPGEYIDPNNPNRNRDPNRGSEPTDPAPPANQPRDPGDPGQPPPRFDPPASGTDPLDPGNPGRQPPRVDPPTSGNDSRQPGDVYTGGTQLAANDAPRDTYTGGQVSGLTSTEPPRDPVTAGTGLLPSGALLTRNQALDYLSDRSPGLSQALRSFA